MAEWVAWDWQWRGSERIAKALGSVDAPDLEAAQRQAATRFGACRVQSKASFDVDQEESEATRRREGRRQ